MKKENSKHHNHDNHHEHGHHGHHDHHKITNKKKLIVVIILNSIITISEFIGGILSGSLALISDAGHNLSDVLALIFGYAGEKISEKDPNKDYTFGLKRFEVLIALINALSLIAIGIFIIYEAFIRFFESFTVDIRIMMPIAVIGLLGNLFSIIVISKNRDSNLNMRAAFLHLFYDTISSVGVIIAGIVIHYTKFYQIDLAISIVIVIMIFWSTKNIIWDSIRIFLQGVPKNVDTEVIYKNILETEDVGDAHGLHVWSINSTEIFLSCHVCVNDNNKNVDTDEIIKSINSMLDEKFNIRHTTLQVERCNICKLENGDCCR